MASYELRFKRSIRKDLRSIPPPDVKKILATIEQLANDPRPPGCEKLSAQERYRVRQGRYRIPYEVEDQHLIITVVKVAHRKHVYRR